MKFSFAALLVATAFNASAADTTSHTSNITVKVYAMTTNNVTTTNIRNLNYPFLNPKMELTYHNILTPTAAINIANKRGNQHEIELTALRINKSSQKEVAVQNGTTVILGGDEITETGIALRYEYIRTFLKKHKLQPALGLAASPYYMRQHYVPYVTSIYPYNQSIIGVQTFLIPRLNYYWGKRVVLDLNFPLQVMDIRATYQKTMNPTLNANQQRYGIAELIAFQNIFYARLGIGVKL